MNQTCSLAYSTFPCVCLIQQHCCCYISEALKTFKFYVLINFTNISGHKAFSNANKLLLLKKNCSDVLYTSPTIIFYK